MDQLNEHCILTFMSYLNIGAILSFGATNVRHHGIVSNFLRILAARGTIPFRLWCSQSTIREIFQRFGAFFYHLDIHIAEDMINMDIFQDFDGCLTFNLHRLILRVAMEEPNQELVELGGIHTNEYEDIINQQQIANNMQQMINQFRRNSQIVIDCINSNAIPQLRNIALHFELQLSSPTHIFLNRSMFVNSLDPILHLLFSSLLRGHRSYAF